MPRIGHKCYRFKVSEVCLITIVRLGRSVGRPPMLPCQKIRAQSLQGGPRGWQTGRRTHLNQDAIWFTSQNLFIHCSKTAQRIELKFFGDSQQVPQKYGVKKKFPKSGFWSGFFRKNPDFGNGLPDPAQNFCVLSTYARHLVHPPKNPDPAVRLPENRINCLHYTGKS